MLVCLMWTWVFARDWKETRRRERLTMMIFFLVTSFLYASHFIYFNRWISVMPLTDIIYSSANLAVYPIFLIYIISLTCRTFKWQTLLWLSPAILTFFACLLIYLFLSEYDWQKFIWTYLYHNSHQGLSGLTLILAWMHDGMKVCFALLVVGVLITGIRLTRRYEKELEQYYSSPEYVSLRRFSVFLFLFFVISLLSFVVNIIGRHTFLQSPLTLATPSVLFSVLLFILGDEAHRLEHTASDLPVIESEFSDSESLIDCSKRNEQMIKLFQSVETLMEEEKIYLQSGLRLRDIATKLASNENYVYHAISIGANCNFSEFVNRYRCKAARNLIQQHPEMALTEIAQRSGFASQSSFYRNFSNFYGRTPKTERDIRRTENKN